MEEFFTIVGHKNAKDPKSEITPQGCVTRNLAHSPARIPHASVQIIPVRSNTGTVIIHQRSNAVRTDKEKWDVFGGHVSFEMGILLAPHGLGEASLETSLREAREEILITIDNKVHLIQKVHLTQIGPIGGFVSGIDDPTSENVEYSTVFALCIPEHGHISTPFELKETRTIQWLPIEELSWQELLEVYTGQEATPFTQRFLEKGFADGITRIFKQVLASDTTRQEVEDKLDWCKKQTP